MRKLLFIVFAVVAACAIGSCVADEEESDVAQSGMVADKKLKILEMAKDYGLNVRIDDELLAKYAADVNLDTLDMCFKALSSIKGTYKLEKPKRNGNVFKTKQRQSIRRGKQQEHFTYEYVPDPVNGKYGKYSCYCCLSWTVDTITGNFTSSSAHGYVECESALLSSYSNICTNIRNYTIIDIDGYIDVPVVFGNLYSGALWVDRNKTITVRFEVYGDYGGETNVITWDCKEDLYNELRYDYTLF